MANAYNKVPTPQILEACPRIFATAQQFSLWLNDMDLDDFFEDPTMAEHIDDEIYTFLNTLDALGKHPSTSQLAKNASDLFDAAYDIFLSICVFDVYIEEHPHLSLDDYQADRDAFLQSLAMF